MIHIAVNIVLGLCVIALAYMTYKNAEVFNLTITLVSKRLNSFADAIDDFDANWRKSKEELENNINDARNRVFLVEGNKATWEVVKELDKRVALLSGQPTVTKFSYDPELSERGLQGEFDFKTVGETKGPGVERE